MDFQDHFSKQSDIYLKARPTYPDDLFRFLSSVSATHSLCWDCATGNGQAAVSLSQYFDRVIATDASVRQLNNAIPAAKVEYRLAAAEHSGIEDASVDLITVATAAHWFKHDLFYTEVNRVAKPGGILAIWTYGEAMISKEIDVLMNWFMYDYLYDYWPDARWYVRDKYTTLPFPFEAMNTPAFSCKVVWQREQWLNYIRSWSAYNSYVLKNGIDPLNKLFPRLAELWGESEEKHVEWPLHLKCARL
ncbi:MAG: class I SAM-dependent methyltransferase [Chitinophagales bacterium]